MKYKLPVNPSHFLGVLALFTILLTNCYSASVENFEEHGVYTVSDSVDPSIWENRSHDVSGFSLGEKDEILTRHNELRGFTKASNMIRMVWDDNIEQNAQKYTEQCKFLHSDPSTRQNLFGFQKLGENIYLSYAQVNPMVAVQAWYDEFDYYENDDESKSCNETNLCVHYKQVVWAKTKAVGCGIRSCAEVENSNFNSGYLVICQYGEGAEPGEAPYKKGEVCSECPEDMQTCEENLCSTAVVAKDVESDTSSKNKSKKTPGPKASGTRSNLNADEALMFSLSLILCILR